MNTPNLDKVFGPRQSATGPPEPKRTAWPNVPERIRATLDAFEEMAGYHPRSEAVRNSWKAGARAFVEELGEQPELVKQAYRKMQNANLTISTPRSLITVARRVRRSNAALSDYGVGLCPECMTYHSKEDGCE